jgi:O-antigen/teichoic acid export membrane protein
VLFRSGLGMFITAVFQLTKKLGNGWWHTSLRGAFVATKQSANNEEIAHLQWHAAQMSGEEQERPRNDMNFREIFKFAISSNLSATAILVFRESDILWVGYFLTTEAAGYYKAAYGIISLLAVASNPFILTTYPEINKLVTQKAWPRLKDFLKKISSIAVVYNLALAAGFVIFGKWLLSLSGEQFVAAYPVLLALLVGYTFNYILFWNRPLLLSLSLPQFPIYATLIVGLFKLAFSFPLIPRYGVVAAGALLSFYYIASVGVMVLRGLKEIKMKEAR